MSMTVLHPNDYEVNVHCFVTVTTVANVFEVMAGPSLLLSQSSEANYFLEQSLLYKTSCGCCGVA